MASERFQEELKSKIEDLTRFAYSMARNTEIAEELISETCLAALQNADQYTEGTNMAAWLYTIQVGIFRNMMRKNQKRIRFETDVDSTEVGFPAPQESRLNLADVGKAIKSLPDEQRAALFLVSYDGYSYDDAARILECEVGTVKSRVFRARAAVAKAIEGIKQQGGMAPPLSRMR